MINLSAHFTNLCPCYCVLHSDMEKQCYKAAGQASWRPWVSGRNANNRQVLLSLRQDTGLNSPTNHWTIEIFYLFVESCVLKTYWSGNETFLVSLLFSLLELYCVDKMTTKIKIKSSRLVAVVEVSHVFQRSCNQDIRVDKQWWEIC